MKSDVFKAYLNNIEDSTVCNLYKGHHVESIMNERRDSVGLGARVKEKH